MKASASFLALVIPTVLAHVTLWSPGLYNFNGTATGQLVDWNTNQAVNPLRRTDNYTEEQWWGHGDLARPPKAGDFLEVPANGVASYSVACNRALSIYRDPVLDVSPLQPYACGEEGPLHTINNFGSPPNDTWLGGCVLAIAYESDVTKISPSHMTVISVNHTCVWYNDVSFDFPDLPACPAEGCHCSWGWIHQSGNENAEGRGEGYGGEMYHNLYRCKVTGAKSNRIVSGTPGVAIECLNDTSRCTTGPVQPHYWSQVSGNNNFAATPPLHNLMYGFKNGAQHDIFLSSTSTASSSQPVRSPSHSFSTVGSLLLSALLSSLLY